jgi:hypothetical protein
MLYVLTIRSNLIRHIREINITMVPYERKTAPAAIIRTVQASSEC